MRREEAGKSRVAILERIKQREIDFPLLDDAIRSRENPLVGEIGAGYCQIILNLIDKHNLPAAIAFDISAESLEFSTYVSENLFHSHPARRLMLVPGDIFETGLDFWGKFDVLVIIATAHHFPDPLPLYVRAYQMLKPGGVMYFDREALRSWIGLHELARNRTGLKTFWTNMQQRRMGILETQFSLKDHLEEQICQQDRVQIL